MNVTDYPFTQEDSKRAFDEWGANCGPNALAFALGISLDDVRGKIPQFEERHYTSPSMMDAALKALGVEVFRVQKPHRDWMCSDAMALVRIQWTGPWTKPGANPKWAYRQTHWIATWNTDANHPFGEPMVFDVNGGIALMQNWEQQIVPALVAMYPRADGGWFPTHVWEVSR